MIMEEIGALPVALKVVILILMLYLMFKVTAKIFKAILFVGFVIAVVAVIKSHFSL